MKKQIKTLLYLAGLTIGINSYAANIMPEDIKFSLKKEQIYTVKKGDTLWDISSHFLKTPWKWPSIWKTNPHIKNPDLIYPNDIIILKFDKKNRPFITIQRGIKAVKLSPSIKSKEIQKIPTVKYSKIKNHILKNEIINKKLINDFSKVIMKEELIASKNSFIYSINKNARVGDVFAISKEEIALEKNGEVKAYRLIKSGEAKVVSRIANNLIELKVLSSSKGIKEKNKLFKIETFVQPYIFPNKYNGHDGAIISLGESLKAAGNNDNVILNIGKKENVSIGNILSIKEKDTEKKISKKETINIPGKIIGELIIYKVYDDFSYGLITKATKPINKNDSVISPKK